MPQVTVYTKPLCPYCFRALSLLKKKGVDVNEISVGFDRQKREEMLARSNGKATYPQVFIGDDHIGGCDDLMALDSAGKLDPLLNG